MNNYQWVDLVYLVTLLSPPTLYYGLLFFDFPFLGVDLFAILALGRWKLSLQGWDRLFFRFYENVHVKSYGILRDNCKDIQISNSLLNFKANY